MTDIISRAVGNGLVGEFFYPDDGVSHAGVLFIGGSSGGISSEMAGPLASEGFAVLALGYFGLKGLPAEFVELPLEYFERATEWLLDQQQVAGNKVAAIGSSRGSEAALQLATIMPDAVGAVVGYVPSGIRWAGKGSKAPWRYHGSDLPYAHWLSDKPHEEHGAITKVGIFNEILDRLDLYHAAVIQVEKADCPMLLISGSDDQLWPSERMASQIIERLRIHNYAHQYRHITYANAGHRIKAPGLAASRYVPVSEDTVTHEVLNLGGTFEGNKVASEQAFTEVVKFLRAVRL